MTTDALDLAITTTGHVRTVDFDRPHVLNANRNRTLDELLEAAATSHHPTTRKDT